MVNKEDARSILLENYEHTGRFRKGDRGKKDK